MRMRIFFFLLLAVCLSCAVSKRYNRYIGKTTDELISSEGTPSKIEADSGSGEVLVYRRPLNVHNPAYSPVTEIVCFYVSARGEVYKWSKWKAKGTRPTPKPSLAMD